MIEDIISYNRFDHVDLDLPSKTLWATCNVGARKPSDSGLYFQWGDTIGYSKDQVGKDKQFTWNDYKWNPSGYGRTYTKYTNPGAKLEPEDDAANFHMGGSWHIPSPAQIQELLDNTTNEWAILDGVNGRLFKSKKNLFKSIFIPAAGYARDGSVNDSGSFGFIWSSMLGDNSVSYGRGLGFFSGNVNLFSDCRDDGFPIRGIY